MRRFYQADLLRAVAVIMVLMYHFWVVCGYKTTGIGPLNTFIGYGGELGVTVFFVLSGFGITCSLFSADLRGEKTGFLPFMKKRLVRIYPQYVCSIVFALLIGTMNEYPPDAVAKTTAYHLLLIHNLSIDHHGTISGVLWTMGVIFQFYILAIPLYMLMKKKTKLFLAASILFTVIVKALVFAFAVPSDETAAARYFVYGRQLYTALDNFAIGMFIAYTALNSKQKRISTSLGLVLLGAAVLVFAVWCIFVTPKFVVYSNTFFGYIWHSITAVIIGLVFYAMLLTDINEKSLLFRPFAFVSKYEYGIYLFHLLVANLLMSVSPTFQKLAENYWYFAFIMLTVSLTVGWLSTKIIDSK